ncbi:MAG: hypothetical protein K6T91_04270 [Firmicutes bacterium]|nr:hypothetical protein [Bacillota bacterium]
MLKIEKPGTYDYILAIATIVILVVLSAIFIYGTVESWINSIKDPGWNTGWLYVDYLKRMNSYAYPFAVALVILLCMCIPKRFVPRGYLLQFSLILLAIDAAVGIQWGLVVGLGFLLFISAVVQTATAIMVVIKSGSLVFERDGVIAQLGSALLHLGFVIFGFDLVAIRDPQAHLNVFWFSTVLVILGLVLSFYSRELSSTAKKLRGERIASGATEGTGTVNRWPL